MFRAAGSVGIDPGRFTFGELMELTAGRDRSDWRLAAKIVAMTANMPGGPKKAGGGAWQAADLDPCEKEGIGPAAESSMSDSELKIIAAALKGRGRGKR
jgi:hypothetical protein